MSPYHLELLLFLRYNQDLWDPALIEELMHETPVVEDDNTQIDPDESKLKHIYEQEFFRAANTVALLFSSYI